MKLQLKENKLFVLYENKEPYEVKECYVDERQSIADGGTTKKLTSKYK